MKCHEPSKQSAPIVATMQNQKHRNVERARGALWASYALAFPNANFLASTSVLLAFRQVGFLFWLKLQVESSDYEALRTD